MGSTEAEPAAKKAKVEEVVLVTGGTGTVGRGIKELIEKDSKSKADRRWVFAGSADADLQDFASTKKLFESVKPTHVLHLAAVIKGRHEMAKLKADIFIANMKINQNVLQCALDCHCKKVVSCLSSTTYPAARLEDVTEAELQSGPVHESVSGYAHSKRMLDFLTRSMREQHGVDFVTVCPTNIFGTVATLRETGPLFEANLAKCLAAKKSNLPYMVWGTGEVRRQLLYTKDLARMLLWALDNYSEAETINFTGSEVSVKDIANAIAKACKFEGKIEYMVDKPDGPKRVAISDEKYMRLCKGIQPTPFEQACEEVVQEHLAQKADQ